MRFMKLDVASCERIARLKPVIDRETPLGLDLFYAQVQSTPETARFFSSPDHMQRAKSAQAAHWLAISAGEFDARFAANVQRIGLTHARIGLDPRWYIGGYALLLEHLIKAILREMWPKGLIRRNKDAAAADDAAATVAALVKAAMLDMDLSMSAYLDSAEEARVEAELAAQERERALVSASIGSGLANLAASDLTYRMRDDLPQSYIRLRDDFNAAIEQLNNALAHVAVVVNVIHSATGEISDAADSLARSTNKQAANVEETSAAVNEISLAIRKTADAAKDGQRLVSATKEDATGSADVVHRAVDAMRRIEKSSQDIEQIIGVIDEIAFQTNLLALNAGVEAARAGEAGRGFAVVASEVRALAQRATESAKEIKTLISSSSQEVAVGVGLVNETGQTLKKISAQVMELNAVVSAIATAAVEQAAAIQQVNVAVSQIEQDAQRNAAMVEKTTDASRGLSLQAAHLSELIGQFKTKKEDADTDLVTALRKAMGDPASQATNRRIVSSRRTGIPQAIAKANTETQEDGWEGF